VDVVAVRTDAGKIFVEHRRHLTVVTVLRYLENRKREFPDAKIFGAIPESRFRRRPNAQSLGRIPKRRLPCRNGRQLCTATRVPNAIETVGSEAEHSEQEE
jgi:hypothetical protein